MMDELELQRTEFDAEGVRVRWLDEALPDAAVRYGLSIRVHSLPLLISTPPNAKEKT